jgi:hypothetical protein
VFRLARTLVAVAVALAVILSSTGVFSATTALQRYEAAAAKLALPFGSFGGPHPKLSKALCVCNATDQFGVLETSTLASVVFVGCSVYTFNPDGSVLNATTCNDWTLLSK